ncbi:uncharacterized protein LOC142183131 [Leptodactylus fuscus]|uniref:uncharacterized protein LOC142183131 n=1 Tax=Leptodactylus fuscus TaxID=238119 RepID=UPI003F4E7DD4
MVDLLVVMRSDLDRIPEFFQSSVIIWSEIIPSLVWRGARNAEAIERVRRSINARMARFVKAKGGVVIRHKRHEDTSKTWRPSWKGVIITALLGANIILIRVIEALVSNHGLSNAERSTIRKSLCMDMSGDLICKHLTTQLMSLDNLLGRLLCPPYCYITGCLLCPPYCYITGCLLCPPHCYITGRLLCLPYCYITGRLLCPPYCYITGCLLCPYGWFLHGDDCYYYSDGSDRTWNQSRDHCKMIGADLVTIKDKEQEEVIQRSIRQRGEVTYWIGLHYDGDDWRWADGEPYNSSLFQIRTRSLGHCVSMTKSDYYQNNCNSENRWICQKKAVKI